MLHTDTHGRTHGRTTNACTRDVVPNSEHATCNMQHATCNMRHAPCDTRKKTQGVTLNVPDAYNTRHTTCDMQHATCDMQHANMRRSTCDVQHATCNKRRALPLPLHVHMPTCPHATCDRATHRTTRYPTATCKVALESSVAAAASGQRARSEVVMG